MEDDYGKCHDCKKFGTPDCPTSSKCLAFDDRPYFEQKQKKKFTISKKYIKFYSLFFLFHFIGITCTFFLLYFIMRVFDWLWRR